MKGIEEVSMSTAHSGERSYKGTAQRGSTAFPLPLASRKCITYQRSKRRRWWPDFQGCEEAVVVQLELP